MKLKTALNIILDLAYQSCLDPLDCDEEQALFEEAERQQDAMSVVEQFINDNL